jgi:hypothetical protein
MTSLVINLRRSLLTDDPQRQKPYAHVASVRAGKPVRATRHRGNGMFNGEEWRLRTREVMLDAATEAAGHDNIGGALQWLEERFLELPTVEDSSDKSAVVKWLQRNSRTAFALGLHLIGPNGETIASMSELPELDKAFVIHVGDVCKARTVGSISDVVSGGKHGKIIRLLEGTVWKLEAKHEARLGEILQYYSKNNIPYRHVPPGTKVNRTEVEELSTLAKRAAVGTAPTKIPDAPVPPEVIEAARNRPHVAAVEVLRNRVANWSRPKGYEHSIDPKDRVELQKLIAKRRSLGAGWRKFKAEIEELRNTQPRGYKGKLRALKLEEAKAAVTYSEAGRRIRYIMGSTHPTKGGGLLEITHEEAAIIDALPHADIGFNPNEKPMSYLISLGWDTTTPKGDKKFSKREFDALLFEYERFIHRTVGRIVKRFEPALAYEGGGVREEAGGWTKKHRRQKYKEWVQEAQTILYDLAQRYESTGAPSESNNFLIYAHTVLPLNLVKFIKDDIGIKVRESVFVSDLESMPERGGKLLTPHARIETPEQALYRRELETGASKLFSNILSPLESAVVMARLNFEGAQQHVYTPSKGAQQLTMGDMMSWTGVRNTVIANLGEFIPDDTKRKEAEAVVAKMYDATLSKLFNSAMDKLREHATQLDPSEKRTLAELAHLKTLYLEGIRHETWDQSESFGKLIVKPEKGEVVDDSARKRIKIRPMMADTKILRFWQRHPDLATQVRIDAFFTDMPGIERSRKVEIDEIKAHHYYRMLDDLRHKQVKTLQRDLVAHTVPPDSTYRGSKVRMPQAHYQALMQFILDEKLVAKGSTKKSFVILDCIAAINGLVAECRVWDLQSGVM